MSETASFRPKRGTRQAAIDNNIILKEGEVYFELPEDGSGTGAGNIVIGDGHTAYEDLPVYIAGTNSSKMDKVNPEGSGTFSLNRRSDMSAGEYSVAIGFNTTASGDYSYAEGDNTTASGIGAHAEGLLTVAHAPYSHAEGKDTMTANEDNYVAMYAHVEGWGSVANNFYEHAEGRWNVSNVDRPSEWGSAGNTLHSVGIGTSVTEKKNAFEIMQNGDAYLNGVGNYDGSTISGASTVQDTINGLNTNLTAGNLKFQFATDGEGNYGYLGADGSFIPFKKGAANPQVIESRFIARVWNTLRTDNVLNIPSNSSGVTYTIQNSGLCILDIFHQQMAGPSYSYTGYIQLNGTDVYRKVVNMYGEWYTKVQFDVKAGDELFFYLSGDANNQFKCTLNIIQ